MAMHDYEATGVLVRRKGRPGKAYIQPEEGLFAWGMLRPVTRGGERMSEATIYSADEIRAAFQWGAL